VLWLGGGVGLDLGLRYTSVRWQGDRLNGLGASLAVVAPL
jgi:outer membrane receptor protein involved in Fe transport